MHGKLSLEKTSFKSCLEGGGPNLNRLHSEKAFAEPCAPWNSCPQKPLLLPMLLTDLDAQASAGSLLVVLREYHHISLPLKLSL